MFTVASALCGMAQTMAQMVAFRILQGFGGGGIVPISQAILLESFKPSERGKAMAIFGKHSTMEYFYDLYEDLQNNLELSPNIMEVSQENNKRILEFYALIKNELGIKD